MILTFHSALAIDEGVARVRDLFTSTFQNEPETVASAPGRVNIIGEHIDYSGGSCLPMALPHRTFIAMIKRSDGVIRLTSDAQSDVWEGTIDAFRHGVVPHWSAYVGGVIVWLGELTGLELNGCDIAVVSSVPIGAGLSSSAALECATAFAAMAVTGRGDELSDDATLHTIAKAAIMAENKVAGANTGGMDQYASLFSIENTALHLQCDDFSFERVPFSLEKHGLELLVIDTRASHSLTDGQYGSRRELADSSAKILGVDHLCQADVDRVSELDEARQPIARHAITEHQRVDNFARHLSDGNFEACGAELLESHRSLRDDYRVSCPELDAVVEAAMDAGALGARMTGGGFGGSAIALIDAARSDEIARAIANHSRESGFPEPHFLIATPAHGASTH